jgi:hypothetical protein
LYGRGLTNLNNIDNTQDDNFSMRSLHLNGNVPSPMLSNQAVQSTSTMKANHDFPSHLLPAQSIQHVLKECAGKAIQTIKYGTRNGKSTKKNTKNKRYQKKNKGNNGNREAKKSNMLGSMFIGTQDENNNNPTPKDLVNFLRSITTEHKNMPKGFSWIFSRFSGCTGVPNRDAWVECGTCWICNRCRPCRFHFSPGLSGVAGSKIALKLACHNWQPLSMDTIDGGGVKSPGSHRRMSFVQPANVVVMVPPGRTQYTFLITHPSKKIHGQLVDEETYALDQLTEPSEQRLQTNINHDFHFLKKKRDRRNSRRKDSRRKDSRRKDSRRKDSRRNSERGSEGTLSRCSSGSSMSSWNSNASSDSSAASSASGSSSSSDSSGEEEEPEDVATTQPTQPSQQEAIQSNLLTIKRQKRSMDNEYGEQFLGLVNYLEIPPLTSLTAPDDRVDGKKLQLNFDEDVAAHDPTVWCRSRSIFKTFRQESVHSLTSEFEMHWKYVRIKRLVRRVVVVFLVECGFWVSGFVVLWYCGICF